MDPGHSAAPVLAGAIDRLRSRLETYATAATRDWWAKYLKGAASFRGVKMGDLRVAVHAWFEEERLGEHLSIEQQKDLALLLLEADYAEDQLAGIVLLQEILLPAGALDWRSDLPRFACLFSEGHIRDWNVCDWFCVKVLGPLVQQEGEACARAISAWREADNLWQRRASVVAFANLARFGDGNFPGFSATVLESCAHLLGSRERFAQTGVGWILRELSRSEESRVVEFIDTNLYRFSREGLKNATKYLRPEVAARLRQAHPGRPADAGGHR